MGKQSKDAQEDSLGENSLTKYLSITIDYLTYHRNSTGNVLNIDREPIREGPPF